jgi:branched-chain amino acid transport system permease protein
VLLVGSAGLWPVRKRQRQAPGAKFPHGAGWFLLIFALGISPIHGPLCQDVAINVLIYICLGLGLNIVVGLAGMLDLGYIAFTGWALTPMP